MYPPARSAFPRRSGFTLIELLAVIAIIGVLAGILIPVAGRVRESARAAACATNLRTLHQATALYAVEHKGVYPVNHGATKSPATAWWQELFPAYCSTGEIFRCQTDETGFSGAYRDTWSRNGLTLPNGKVSYGAAGHVGAVTNGTRTDFKALGKKENLFTRPTISVLYTEHQHADKRLGEVWHHAAPRWTSETTYPHRNKANLVFLDGHVARMSESEVVAARTAGSLVFDPADF